MAKNNNKDLDRLDQFLNDFIKEFETSVRKEMKPLGNKLLKEIQERTIEGNGVTDSGKIKPFKRLKKSTIASRHSKQKNGKLSSLTTPEKSNQIETGHMIMDAKVKIKNKSKGLGVEIAPPKDREDIQTYQEDMGRTAFNIDTDQQQYIEDLVSGCADKAIKKVSK